MKYDNEKDVISIGIKEFVSVSRRMISPVPPSEESETELSYASRLAFKIAGIARPEEKELSHDFILADCKARIFGKIYTENGTRVTLIYECEENPNKPSRETLSKARGEAYISAFILKCAEELEAVDIKIILINSSSSLFSEISETVSAQRLDTFFERCRKTLEIYAAPELDRVKNRLPSLKNLKFPYKSARSGQREFIESVYKSISKGGRLYATAPTGTGKTVSVIYPALLALGRGKCDKVFYFTPKATTAIAAMDCIELFKSLGASVRAVCLYAKEKLCDGGVVCREDRKLCESASSNNMQKALLSLYEKKLSVVKREDIKASAREFKVCPHELALCYSELCDIVILDVNYLFDPKVYIRRFFTEGGNYAYLIDEAHNLPDRAREMYSAEISASFLLSPEKEELLGAFSETKKLAPILEAAFRDTLYPYLKEDIRTDEDGKESAAVHLSEIPTKLYPIFESAIEKLQEEVTLNFRASDEEKQQRIKYLCNYLTALKRFYSVMNEFDNCYEMFVFLEENDIRVKLFCIDTGKKIAQRLDTGRSAVFFSGTLSPLHYYRSTLGGDGSSDILELDSPFDTGQLSVSIMDKVSTRYSEREDTLLAVSRIIAATVSAKRGNYMIFSPSFAYSEALYKAFSMKYPKIHTILQKKNMSERERNAFLAEFSKNDGSYLIAFCVMGGIYSEGVDLAGDSLIGAVVVGLGLPSLSFEREAIAAYYQEKYEEGREFAYIYPGIGRVLQAGGRVIRREDDRGVIVLIDDRFDDPIYKKLLPKLWSKVKFIPNANELRAELDEFWSIDKK